MSAKRYALINADGVVVNCIVGLLDEQQQRAILESQRQMNGATQIVAVEEGVPVWIGGSYTDGVFAAPPVPEPEPTIVEGTSEVLPEPQPEIQP